MARNANKSQLYIVVPADTGPKATRLIKGTLKEIESKLRGEVEIRPATAEDGRAYANLDIEDATGEPTA